MHKAFEKIVLLDNKKLQIYPNKDKRLDSCKSEVSTGALLQIVKI
jgi:hypothetical protein